MNRRLRHTLARRLTRAVCIGDAIGATSEFQSQSRVLEFYNTVKDTGWPFAPIGGGAFGWKPGETTDDGDQAKLLYDTLKLNRFDSLDVIKFAGELFKWAGSARDVGRLTRRVTGLMKEHPYMEAARIAWMDNPDNAPNGALSRNAAVSCASTLDQAFLWSFKQTVVTHYSPMCVLCSAIQTWLLRAIFNSNWPWSNPDWMRSWHADWTEWFTACKDADVLAWRRTVDDHELFDVNYLDKHMDEVVSANLDDIPSSGWNPFEEPIRGSGGGALITLKIAIWALWVAHAPKGVIKLPDGYPAGMSESRGTFAMCLPALVGRDADSYCAVAAPLVMASTGGYIPKAFKMVQYQ